MFASLLHSYVYAWVDSMTYEEFMNSPGENAAPDRKITLDIFDIADILTAAPMKYGFSCRAGRLISRHCSWAR